MIDKNECLVIRNKTENGYSLVMLHDITIRETSIGLITTRESLKKLITNPYVTDNKDSIPYFKIGLISEDSIQTTTPIMKFTRLVLDYDNDSKDKYLLDKFVDKFKDYSFLLFTTFSAKRFLPRFKVILRLSNAVDYRMFNSKAFTEDIVNRFTIGNEKVDISCLRATQFQRLPCKKPNGFYTYVFNKGKPYSLCKGEAFKDYHEPNMMDMMIKYNLKINTIVSDKNREKDIKERIEISKAGIKSKYFDKFLIKNKKVHKEYIRDRIVRTRYLHRHDFIMDVAIWVYNKVFSFEEVKQMCEEATGRIMTDKHVKKLNDCLKSLERNDKKKDAV